MNDLKIKCFKKLYIDDSPISGKGLFAGEDINIGDFILCFGGTLARQTDRFSGLYIDSTFVGISESIMLCETIESQKDLSDFINHSCDPNAGMFDCLTIMAIKKICTGEEILCDYSFWEADRSWVLKTKCRCGSHNCRKNITGNDWEKITPNDASYEFYSPFLKRRILENAKTKGT